MAKPKTNPKQKDLERTASRIREVQQKFHEQMKQLQAEIRALRRAYDGALTRRLQAAARRKLDK
jgi:uncharacterized protein YukE